MAEAKELDNLLGSDKEEPEETEEGEEEEEEEEEKEFVMPEKFKGKSPEEIAKSYSELEKMVEKKAEARAEEILKEKEEEGEEEEEPEEIEEKPEIPMREGKPDFASMTPDQFADYMDKRIEQRAAEIANKAIEDSTRVRESVSSEIVEAQEKHPSLKTSDEYRELVLAIIESAATKGKIVSLEDACTKVDGLIGKKEEVGEKEEEKLKRAKAVIEKGAGAPPSGAPETEEERIKKALLGEGTKSPLGGLGI